MKNFMKNIIARILVSDKELVKHLPLFLPPNTNLNELIKYIRWNVAIGKIPRHR